jgi:hypothetical protein
MAHKKKPRAGGAGNGAEDNRQDTEDHAPSEGPRKGLFFRIDHNDQEIWFDVPPYDGRPVTLVERRGGFEYCWQQRLSSPIQQNALVWPPGAGWEPYAEDDCDLVQFRRPVQRARTEKGGA